MIAGYVWQILGRGAFLSPHPWAALKMCILNRVNNDYQQNLKVLYILVPNETLGLSLEIAPTNFIFLKTLNSEFSYIEVCLTDQNSKPLETENKHNFSY